MSLFLFCLWSVKIRFWPRNFIKKNMKNKWLKQIFIFINSWHCRNTLTATSTPPNRRTTPQNAHQIRPYPRSYVSTARNYATDVNHSPVCICKQDILCVGGFKWGREKWYSRKSFPHTNKHRYFNGNTKLFTIFIGFFARQKKSKVMFL